MHCNNVSSLSLSLSLTHTHTHTHNSFASFNLIANGLSSFYRETSRRRRQEGKYTTRFGSPVFSYQNPPSICNPITFHTTTSSNFHVWLFCYFYNVCLKEGKQESYETCEWMATIEFTALPYRTYLLVYVWRKKLFLLTGGLWFPRPFNQTHVYKASF